DPSGLVLDLSLGLTETPPVHPALILSALTITLPVERSYALDVLQNYCCSLLDCHCYDRFRGVVEYVTGSRDSSSPILRRYFRLYSVIVPCERGDDTQRSVGYSHTLREVIVACLLVVSNCEIAKITVHTDRGRAFYPGSVGADAETQSVPGEGERANLDSRSGYD